jgi:opacity protein-like surface antigen
MKAPSATLVPALLLLASACASTSPTPGMPAWAPAEGVALVASAPRDIDDDLMRVPRPVEDRQTTWAESGLYLGGMLVTSQPLGDFDGDTALAGPTDFVLVPDLDPGAGAGVFLSYRWHMNEMVAQYTLTDHDGDFSGTGREHDTTFYDFDLNWRHYWWQSSFLQPYGLLGLGYSRAKVDNGTTDQATGTIFDDAYLRDGIAVNVGLGASISLKWATLFGQGVYRFVRYETSRGLDGEFSNTPDIDGDSVGLQFGAQIRVLPPRK